MKPVKPTAAVKPADLTTPIDPVAATGPDNPPAGSSSAARSTTVARPRRLNPVRAVLGSVWQGGSGRFSLIVLLLWLAACLLASLWTPWPLGRTDGFHAWAAPSAAHPMGTDGTGRDMLSWLMAGSLTELQIVLATCLLAALVGLLFISLTLTRRALSSEIVTVVIDTLLSIPIVLIALILAVPLGSSLLVVIVACGISYGLNLARIAKPQAQLAASSPYFEAARAAGSSRGRAIRRHVLPNLIPIASVQLSLCAGTAILAEAGLTYLGIGVPAGTPSWGSSLSQAASFISLYPLTVVWPGALITLVVVALNLFGDSLPTALDPVANPRLRSQDVDVERAVGAGETGQTAGAGGTGLVAGAGSPAATVAASAAAVTSGGVDPSVATTGRGQTDSPRGHSQGEEASDES